MRILIVLPDQPLPFGMAAARWYHVLVQGLTARGHDLKVFIVCEGPMPADVAATIRLNWDDRIEHYPPTHRVGPLGKLRSWRRPFEYRYHRALKYDLKRAMAEGYDVLHLEQTWSAYAAPADAPRSLVHVHHLWSIDAPGRSRVSLRDRLIRRSAIRVERELLGRFGRITALTPRLAAEIGRINPSAIVDTIPMALDLSLYPFDADGPIGQPPTVALIGSFDWAPTLSAARRLALRLWPEIVHRVPGARLRLVGRWADRALADLPRCSDITIHADVPEIIPEFRRADVLLYAPGPASGMKVKVLEAFALGTPVVTNADGVEGIAAVDGVHAGIAGDDGGLVDRAVALLRDGDARRGMRREARRLVESTCDPSSALDRLEAVYRSIVEEAKSAGEVVGLLPRRIQEPDPNPLPDYPEGGPDWPRGGA